MRGEVVKKKRKGQKRREERGDRSHLCFFRSKAERGYRKLFVVACLGGSLSVWGHDLTWSAILFQRYYSSAQPHAKPSKESQPAGSGTLRERTGGVLKLLGEEM